MSAIVPFTYDLAGINLAQPMTFAVANVAFPIVSSFDRDVFWNEFKTKQPTNTVWELIELLIDISRCHFGPKPTNWPGVKVTVTYHDGSNNQTRDIDLAKGSSKLKSFNRGRGTWNWTHACLATSGLFHEVWHSNAAGKAAAARINGSHDGHTIYSSTLHNWTQLLQDQAETAMDTWITSIGAKAMDEDRKKKMKTAASNTISNRTKLTSAYGIRNILRVLVSGAAIEEGSNPTYA